MWQCSDSTALCSSQSRLCCTLTQVVQCLVGLVSRPDAKDEDSLLVTENAVAALGTLCVSPALSGAVDRSQLLPLWLSHLPLKEVRWVRTLCGVQPKPCRAMWMVLSDTSMCEAQSRRGDALVALARSMQSFVFEPDTKIQRCLAILTEDAFKFQTFESLSDSLNRMKLRLALCTERSVTSWSSKIRVCLVVTSGRQDWNLSRVVRDRLAASHSRVFHDCFIG